MIRYAYLSPVRCARDTVRTAVCAWFMVAKRSLKASERSTSGSVVSRAARGNILNWTSFRVTQVQHVYFILNLSDPLHVCPSWVCNTSGELWKFSSVGLNKKTSDNIYYFLFLTPGKRGDHGAPGSWRRG